jgi:hypothetical protein
MKKIKSIKQLKYQKKLIKQRQAGLEEKIRSNWKDLKENLRPLNIAKDALSSVIKRKTEDNLYGDGFVRNALTYGVTVIANKILNKAADKWGKRFKTDSASAD